MSYTPATDVQNFASFQWSTPDYPTPRLASPIDATTTTITFTAPPLDRSGDVISDAFLMGIRNTTGYVETVYVPQGALSADGLTATGVTRGINLEGLDFTTGDASLAVEADQSSTVFCNVSGIIQAINQSALSAEIGSNIMFNGRPLWDGTCPASVPVFATTVARDAAITSPQNGDSCYVTTSGEFYDYQAGAWGVRATGVATPNGSTTVAGKWQGATIAQQTTATDTGSTGAELIPLNKNLTITSAGAANAGQINILNASGYNDPTTLGSGTGSAANYLRGDSSWTAVPYPKLTTGIATHDVSSTGTQTIAHGLGAIPTMIKIQAVNVMVITGGDLQQSAGTYDGSTANVIYQSIYPTTPSYYSNGSETGYIVHLDYSAGSVYARASITVDATNITLTWSKNSSPTGTAQLLWQAQV